MSAHGSTTQILLPGQAHVAEGPHDQTGMYLMHHAFRRDLIAFETAVRRTPVREAETWCALAARWDRFALVLHHHHAVEDASIWPLLLSEVGDDADRAVLRDMPAEHSRVDPALAATTDAFAAMTENPDEDRRAARRPRSQRCVSCCTSTWRTRSGRRCRCCSAR